jgi:hypothetical protein
MPEIFKSYEKRWESLNPGWSVKTWTDSDFSTKWLANQELFDKAEEFAPSDGVGQFRSDLARYEILHRFGGVYVDCDVEPLKPFDSLLEGVEGFAGWEEDGAFVGNTVLGSVAGNPFFAAMIGEAAGGARSNKGRAVTWMTGPRVLTRVYRDWQDKSNLCVYPQKYFFPYSYNDLKSGASPESRSYPEAYSVHHWAHQREKRGRPLAGSGSGTLSTAIMAHRKREAWVPDLERQLPGVRTVWDLKNDRWDTGARALSAFDKGVEWHMVVQDDALLPPDFLEGVKRMLKYVPPGHPVGLYYGKVRPRPADTHGLVSRAKQENASFIVHNGPWWGVAIVIPTVHIPDIVKWGDANQQVPNYDRRISRWYYHNGPPCYYTVPSLIEHRTEGNPSLVPGRTGQNRCAWNFVGPRSALEVDWSGPVVRGDM